MKKIKNIVNIIYEATVVKRLKRTGWQILGDNEESLGEHCFMTCVISYFLAKETGADMEKTLIMSIFHDFHESRIGDMDKISAFYVKRDITKANADIFSRIDHTLLTLLNEYEKKKTKEARIVYEANIIALLVELKQVEEKGNRHAKEWIRKNAVRLHLPEAKALAETLMKTDSHAWWQGLREKIYIDFLNEK